MDIRIQHIKIIKKSDVLHFYQEMLLTFTFNENLTSLSQHVADPQQTLMSVVDETSDQWQNTRCALGGHFDCFSRVL